jgi:hypothetical protein
MLNTTLKESENIYRLLYDKGNLAVVYRKDDLCKDFIIWPDNFSTLYFKTVINQAIIEHKKVNTKT